MRVNRNVYLVDSDVAQCNALTVYLESSGYKVRIFTSAEAFLENAESMAEGIILMNQCLVGMSGQELQDSLARRGTDMPIVFIIEHSDVRSAVKAIKAGAINVLEKPISNEELLACVKEVFFHAGDNNKNSPWIASVRQRYASMTDREQKVMLHVVNGTSSKEMAELLGISPRTVEVHRARITKKMDAKSVADMVRKHDICQNTGAYRLRGDGTKPTP
jgi:FixJ family two-component response regulator